MNVYLITDEESVRSAKQRGLHPVTIAVVCWVYALGGVISTSCTVRLVAKRRVFGGVTVRRLWCVRNHSTLYCSEVLEKLKSLYCAAERQRRENFYLLFGEIDRR